MDFVPTPPSSNVPPVEIPVLLNAPYQIPGPHDLHTFLQQESADENESLLSAIEIATHIQSKLFLGLLAVLLGTTPNLENISIVKRINGDTGRYFCLESISTNPFSIFHHFGLWSRRKTIVSDMFQVRRKLDSLERLPNGKFSPVPEIALSTRILSDALVIFTQSTGLFPWAEPRREPFSNAMEPFQAQYDIPPSLDLLFSRLQSSGLCSSRFI
ncbi:hypothetical protein N7540_000108 [Penicillium herquei]|nr:hypothetical protein N7540_000108 [Penicillium herquei]